MSKDLSRRSATVDESTEFYAQLGKCISVWAAVEMSLVTLFNACMHGSDVDVASAVYHAVENFRSRLGMIDAALSVVLNGDDLLKEWAGVLGVADKPRKKGLFHKITSASQKRNHLAHYTVMHLTAVKKPPSIYLRETLLKPSSRAGFSSRRPTGGYYVTDLRHIHRQFVELSKAIRDFRDRAAPRITKSLKSLGEERDGLVKRALASVPR